MKHICIHCGLRVIAETDDVLKPEYQYYCPECDESLRSYEVEDVPETFMECEQEFLRSLCFIGVMPINSEMIT